MCIRDSFNASKAKVDNYKELGLNSETATVFNLKTKEQVIPVSYTHLDVYKRQPQSIHVTESIAYAALALLLIGVMILVWMSRSRISKKS